MPNQRVDWAAVEPVREFEELTVDEIKTSNIRGKDGPSTVVIDGTTVINGDLLITGEIKKAFKFELNTKSLVQVRSYLLNDPKREEGVDYHVCRDGIIVLIEKKDEYKGLIMEALI